jgi:hypothetical protein
MFVNTLSQNKITGETRDIVLILPDGKVSDDLWQHGRSRVALSPHWSLPWDCQQQVLRFMWRRRFHSPFFREGRLA